MNNRAFLIPAALVAGVGSGGLGPVRLRSC
jgi:hypothetical protein